MLLLAAFAATAVQGQPKVTLAEYQGDTVLFLRKAFDARKAEFIGQPFSKVLDEWQAQLPVGWLLFGDTGPWVFNPEERELVNSANLYYNTEEEINKKGTRHEPYYRLLVTFAPPLPYKIQEFWRLQEEEEDSQLGPQLYEKLKNYIVEDIKVLEMKR